MIDSAKYTDLRGRQFPLNTLDERERELLAELEDLARSVNTRSDWYNYENSRTKWVGAFYAKRGLTRKQTTRTDLWQIAEDFGARLSLKLGLSQAPDYRDELQLLILERFKSRREFCRATGISEDMLSHVLARRKHLSIESLQNALQRIGYSLRIASTETVDTNVESVSA